MGEAHRPRTPFFDRSASARRDPLVLNLALAAWLATAGNLPFWQAFRALPEHAGLRGAGFALIALTMITALTFALLSLLSWRRLVRPVAVLLLLMAAGSTHFMLAYGIVIDASMVSNALNTNAAEVRDLMSWGMLLSAVLVMGPPLVWLARQPVRALPWMSRLWRNVAACAAASIVLAAMLLLGYQPLASVMRNHKELRYRVNPLNTVYAAGRLMTERVPRTSLPLVPVGEDARLGPSYAAQNGPPLLLLVVGETARAENFSVGGYARDTTPNLTRRRAAGEIAYFGAVQSCGTNTQVSVPCVFSHLGRAGYVATSRDHENLLDVFMRAGLAVLWLDNQSGCKGLCARVPSVETRTLDIAGPCTDGECLDEVMLAGLDERIARLDPVRAARGVVVVMHQMGSHGPAYHRRSPPQHKPFLPECTTNALQDCTHEALVNAYDNSIRYTDHVLDATIAWLQRRRGDAAMIYVSDHGESLGENNMYLHGLPYALAPEQQTRVPMVIWLSASMRKRASATIACLQSRAGRAPSPDTRAPSRDDRTTWRDGRPLSHDNLFHTALGLMDVHTSVRNPGLDLSADCD